MNNIKVGDKIKIVKAEHSAHWYADRIGEVFTVVQDDGVDFKVAE